MAGRRNSRQTHVIGGACFGAVSWLRFTYLSILCNVGRFVGCPSTELVGTICSRFEALVDARASLSFFRLRIREFLNKPQHSASWVSGDLDGGLWCTPLGRSKSLAFFSPLIRRTSTASLRVRGRPAPEAGRPALRFWQCCDNALCDSKTGIYGRRTGA